MNDRIRIIALGIGLGIVLSGCISATSRQIAYHERELQRLRDDPAQSNNVDSEDFKRSLLHYDALVSLGALQRRFFPFQHLVVNGDTCEGIITQFEPLVDNGLILLSGIDPGETNGVIVIDIPERMPLFEELIKKIDRRTNH